MYDNQFTVRPKDRTYMFVVNITPTMPFKMTAYKYY